jgi:hypothetical protein
MTTLTLVPSPRPPDTPSGIAVVAALFLADCPAVTATDLLRCSRGEPVIRQLARAVECARAALR